MGYDSIKCLYPLPNNPPFGKDTWYQTKDFDCMYESYTIFEDGTTDFPDPASLRTIEFYTSNISGAGPGLYTRNGEDAISVTYRALIQNGMVEWIVEAERKVEPALPVAMMMKELMAKPKEEEVMKVREHRERSWKGTRMFYLPGGRDGVGEWGVIEAEDKKNLCFKSEKTGALNMMHRLQIGSTLWESEEEALNDKKEREDDWNKRKKVYEEYAEAWRKAREEGDSGDTLESPAGL